MTCQHPHPRTPFVSPLDGGHPILCPLADAIDHLMQASESNAGVDLSQLRARIGQIKHWLAFLEERARGP